MNDKTKADKMTDAQKAALVGLTLDEVDRLADDLENEDKDDHLTGEVYVGRHHDEPEDDPMESITIRVPRSVLRRATQKAKAYHISRSELMRRQLAGI